MFVVPAILLLLISSTNWTASAETDLVKLVCQMTSDYSGCVEALSSDPRTNGATDIATLSIIGLNLAVANATDVAGFVKQMAADPSTNPNLQAVLSECARGYQNAANSFRSAAKEVESRDEIQFPIAFYDVLSATEGPENCRLEMENNNLGVPAEISKRYEYISLFSDIGGALISVLMNSLSQGR